MVKNRLIVIIILLFVITFSGSAVLYFHKYDTRDYEHRGFLPLPILKPIWERKVETDQTLKLGLITDTHIHPTRINPNSKSDDTPRKLKDKDRKIFDKFNFQMEKFKPDYVIHLGDIVEGTKEKDVVSIKGLELVSKELNKSNVPTYLLIGNHELRSVTKNQFRETMQLEELNYIVDNGDYRFIFLDASYNKDGSDAGPGKGYTPGYLHPETLNWLEDDLKTEKRVFVFMHQATFDRNLMGEENRMKKSIDNAIELSQLLEKYNVEAVFNGHIEVKFYEEKNGVKYFSLVGTKKSKLYPEAYYELIINKGVPQVKMFYKDVENNEERIIDFKSN